MANAEHLEILNQGVQVWNQWREENPEIDPDLEEVVLPGAHFQDVNFAHVYLQGAALEGANLKCANLRGADFDRCKLQAAQFQGADLTGANFGGTNLTDAVLSGAKLLETNFEAAVLQGVQFKGAIFVWTNLTLLDLSSCYGLAEAQHNGLSFIDANTLECTAEGLSKDSTRRVEVATFLRGTGIEEWLIEAFLLRFLRPIEFYSCFISYSHSNKTFASRLHDQLQARGIRCWLDEHDLKPGDRILDVVDDAIRLHDKILLCCSETSLNSWWVKDEIRKAMERERRDGRDIIIPLMVDRYLLDGWEDGLAADLRSRLAADFTGWEHDNAKFEEQFERVVEALRTERQPVSDPKL